MPSYSCASLGAIARHAEATPESAAIINLEGGAINYGELWTLILEVGDRLQEAGVGIQGTAAVLLQQGVTQVIAVAGVLNYCICAPLQPRTSVTEVNEILNRIKASALIVSPSFQAEIDVAINLGIAVLVTSDTESPKNWQILNRAPVRNMPAPSQETRLILITSATTGSSKLVPLSALNLDAGMTSTRDSLGLGASDRLLLMVSLCHRLGIENVFSQFLVGGSVIATGGFDPGAFRGWLFELAPTWYVCAPTIHQAALTELSHGFPQGHTPLRFVQSSGAFLPNEVRHELERVLHVPVLNAYGATEAHHIASESYPFLGHVPGAAGRSCGLEIGIMNSLGELLLPGDEGEIIVRGPAVFPGYLDNPEANRTAFRNGWFCTGDLGSLDHGGNLYVTGRIKEMINRGGEKILPGEVDAVLASHPAVLEAVAFSVPHPTLGEDVACAVVLRPGVEPRISAKELRRFAAEQLARFKVPHRIYFVDEIPRGELGKPQRWQLTEQFTKSQSAHRSPGNAAEDLKAYGIFLPELLEIWARILDRDDLDFDADFFEAGGDSLAAINMLVEVDQRLGRNTAQMAASFLDEPTLKHLATMVGNDQPPTPTRSESSDIRIFPIRESNAGKRMFCFPPDGHEGLLFRRLAKHLGGWMDLSVVRPANTFRNDALFSIEREGAEAAAIIQRTQPEGPYLLGGYCYGGVIAFEAARQLISQKQIVELIFFDVSMPGFPSPLIDWRIWAQRASRQWYLTWNADHPGLKQSLRRLFRVSAWFALVPFRRILLPLEQTSFVRRLLQWVQFDDYPLYRVRPIRARILNFLAKDEPNRIQFLSRLAWRRVARGGVEEHYVPVGHLNLFHESNLSQIVQVLQEWRNGF